jgi:hypothetical protein
MSHRFAILAASLLLIAASEAPSDVPVPQPKPEQSEDAVKPPVPTEAPKEKPNEEAPKAEEPQKVETPKPLEKPEEPKKEEKAEEPKPDPIKEEDPAELQACLVELKQLGAEFKQIEPIRDEEGCGIASPIQLSTVSPDIKLDPPGPMRCETALALARWTKEIMVPTAKIAMPDRKIVAIANASTYVCRNRNSLSTGKISEHAKGSAVDVSSLAFEKGEPLIMKPRDEDGTMEGAFQRTITTAACLFFRTVLSPGSDATHQDHLHLDVLERKGGYLYCR